MIQLQIETINVCNAACVFCPYPVMKREKGRMRQALFEKIINDAEQIPLISQVSFQGLGEPLLDPDIVNRIAYAKSKKPAWVTSMYTNGHSLTPKVAADLEKAGLDVLLVSINAANKHTRKEVMRLDDYEKVVSNVKESIAHAKFMKIKPKGVVNMDILAGAETDEFKRLWGEDAFLHLEGNWGGRTYTPRRQKVDACGRALGQFMVLWDGRVALCCFDSEGDVIFGDLNTQSIREVYSSDAYVHYREMHANGRRGELQLCATCTDI